MTEETEFWMEEKAHRAQCETTKTFIEWNAKLRKTMIIIIITIKWISGQSSSNSERCEGDIQNSDPEPMCTTSD